MMCSAAILFLCLWYSPATHTPVHVLPVPSPAVVAFPGPHRYDAGVAFRKGHSN
jgi:hypothetical protein